MTIIATSYNEDGKEEKKERIDKSKRLAEFIAEAFADDNLVLLEEDRDA